MRGQAPDGGWGLYATSPSEPFDTAVAVLALSAVLDRTRRPELQLGRVRVGASFSSGARDSRAPSRRGRRFLVETQLSDGSWPETTRPTGQESYAQRISTTGWATLALLETTGQ